MPDSADLIRRAGECLYGTRWESALAEALGVNRRTVRRWWQGEVVPEDRQLRRLWELATERGRAIAQLRADLANATE